MPAFAVPAAHTLSEDCVGREAERRLDADLSLWRVKALLDWLFSCFLSQHFGFGWLDYFLMPQHCIRAFTLANKFSGELARFK